jgi:LemA protein
VTWFIGFAVAVVLLMAVRWPIKTHNTLVSMQTTVVEAWRGIDVELTRRWDLIPSLAEVAQTYTRHEADVLTRVVAQRNSAPLDPNPSNAVRELREHVIADETRSDAQLTEALAGLHAVSEAHPDLKSARHYTELLLDLRDTDDRIAAARRLYNGNVSRYNAKLKSFPASLLARWTGMAPAEFCEIVSPEHAAVPPLRPRAT